MENKEIRYYQFGADDKAMFDGIVAHSAKVVAASVTERYGASRLCEFVKLDNYKEENDKMCKMQLEFAAQKAGIETPTTKTEMAYAFGSTTFKEVLNTIIAKTLAAVISNYGAPQIADLAEVVRVGIGDSYSFEIASKALPIAQKGSYGDNVSQVFQEAKSAVTLTPIPYTLGKSLDYIRMVTSYDWGYEIAKVYAGIQFAKYRAIVNALYNNTIVTSTPFNLTSFGAAGYATLASDLELYNGVPAAAYGTTVAWQAISALAVSGGYMTADEYIRNGRLNKIYGVDSYVLPQISDLSAPFTSANASSLRIVPNNKILLLPQGVDKLVKLVEEDYIRVKEIDANDNNLNRQEFVITQSFDVKLATPYMLGVSATTT